MAGKTSALFVLSAAQGGMSVVAHQAVELGRLMRAQVPGLWFCLVNCTIEQTKVGGAGG